MNWQKIGVIMALLAMGVGVAGQTFKDYESSIAGFVFFFGGLIVAILAFFWLVGELFCCMRRRAMERKRGKLTITDSTMLHGKGFIKATGDFDIVSERNKAIDVDVMHDLSGSGSLQARDNIHIGRGSGGHLSKTGDDQQSMQRPRKFFSGWRPKE